MKHDVYSPVKSKFVDDTIVVGQIANNDETEYRKEMEKLVTYARTTFSRSMSARKS